MKRIILLAIALLTTSALAQSPASIGILEGTALTRADYGLMGPVSEVRFQGTCAPLNQWNNVHERTCGTRGVNFNQDGTIAGKTGRDGETISEYKYEDGKLERINRGGGLSAVTRFYYDDENPNIVRAVHYRSDGSDSGRSTFTYDTNGNIIRTRGSFSTTLAGWDTITYDASGRVTQSKSRMFTYTYGYDGDNLHPTTWSTYDIFNKLVDFKIEYDGFDEHGNWLTRRAYMPVMKFGELEHDLMFEENRTINYY